MDITVSTLDEIYSNLVNPLIYKQLTCDPHRLTINHYGYLPRFDMDNAD
jgi:hypothetical protein